MVEASTYLPLEEASRVVATELQFKYLNQARSKELQLKEINHLKSLNLTRM